ncbi:MAG: hypothetical protein FWG22_03515, partial [Prolixibacteraceae bacterium]|nr:hypothetical protein [Prolixibacteraceae bacterium]
MKKMIIFALFFVYAINTSAQSAEAHWIWYPGDFELWLSGKSQVLRTERGMFYAPFWRLDSHAQLVVFGNTVELKEPETVEIRVDGQFYLILDGRFVYETPERIELSAGKHSFHFQVYNPVTPPSVWVKGKSFGSDKTWTASTQNGKTVQADMWIFDMPEYRPSDFKLAVEPHEAVKTEKNGQSVFVDFGKETFGFLKFHNLRGNGEITVIYGESEEEAQAGKDAETYDILKIKQPQAADFVAPGSRAFRYVNVSWTDNISFDKISMLYEFLPLEYKGAFRCNDEKINNIWDVSAYTLHLSSREFFLDGIKRDRWVWSGDAYQSYLMNYYLFFDNSLVKRSTWALRGNDPVETHINTILDYSFYWFIGIYDYYLYAGDKEFLTQIYPKMKTLMDFCLARRNANGMVEGLPGDWVFVDWAPISKKGELSIEQILFCRSLETMVLCANLMNEQDKAKEYQSLADGLRKKIMEVFWDPQQKALVHSRVNGALDKTVTKYANMFAMTFDYLSDVQKAEVKDHVLLNDNVLKITTPYMRFYELEAMCRIKQHEYVLGEIKDYWGGMLKLGATSFWEAYNPEESGAQ